jgi:hypothetical protein
MQTSLVSPTSRAMGRAEAGNTPPEAPHNVGPGINTVLAVREHAPAEIDELELQIKSLHHRLGAAYARKHLLERLVAVIREADGLHTAAQPGIAIVR